MPHPLTNPTATIAASASLSSQFYIGAGRLVAIQMPAAWTAANITFQASQDGTNFFNCYDNAGNEVTIVAPAANENISLDGFEGGAWMKVRSGTSGTPVTQAVAAILTMAVRKLPISLASMAS